ncbi:MAG: F0F1 ATP synthase subunit delta [Gammaproteobacteria bacterium]|nr:F0F1 ATP synthase subunit delta [Gammaproteobacteria bacterium]
MAEKVTIARPYAKAVFALACEREKLAQWSEFLGNAASAVSDRRVADLLNSPRVTRAELADLIIELCGSQDDELAGNVIRVLAQYRRLNVLPEIVTLFEALRAEYENSVDVSLISALPVSQAQQDKIAAALRKRLGRDVRLHCEIDESLIGGAVIRAGDLVIDGSLSGRLARLATELTH